MLAVVKTPLTNIEIKGAISPALLKLLKKEFGDALKVKAETEAVNVFGTDLYKEFKDKVTPGDYVKTYRKNLGLTQAQLGKRLGVSRSYICDIEHNRRNISKEKAKTLSRIFKVSVERFI